MPSSPPAICRHYCGRMRRRVLIAVVVVLLLGGGWMVMPAFAEPADHRSCDHVGGSWGYDIAARAWTCGDNWLVKIGRYGINGI